MKIKLGIICGIIIWFFTNLITAIIQPSIIDDITYLNLIFPLSIIIFTGFFGIIYIREINENEIIEGMQVGFLFVIIDIICDLIFFILPNNTNVLLLNYPSHIMLMLLLMLLTTTFLGYLAQMNIELKWEVIYAIKSSSTLWIISIKR